MTNKAAAFILTASFLFLFASPFVPPLVLLFIAAAIASLFYIVYTVIKLTTEMEETLSDTRH